MPTKSLHLLCVFALNLHASPEQAERIKRSFELATETWSLKMKIASDPVEQAKLTASRPDVSRAAKEIWQSISPALREEWTIPYAAFFYSLTAKETTLDDQGNAKLSFLSEREQILKIYSSTHLNNSDLSPFLISLIENGDAKNLSLFDKVIESNPNKAAKGIAALGAAIMIKNIGDSPELMKKRLTYLRQAVIHAADQTVGSMSIADIVSDELYIVRYLMPGRVAPELKGADAAGRIVQLSDFRGKALVLLFWDAASPDTERIIQFTNKMVSQYAGDKVAVLGITPEPLDRIRSLQGDGSIKWNNIIDSTDKLAKEYRVAVRPLMLILDASGKIEFLGQPSSFAELSLDSLIRGKSEKAK